MGAAGIDAALAGWDDQQMAERLGGPTITDDTENAAELASKAAEMQREWSVAPGDLFQIGGHRLLCGDCTAEAGWRALLGGRVADMVWCDPPYNVAYTGAAGAMANDDMSDRAYAEFLRNVFGSAFRITKLGGAIYVAHADSEGQIVRAAFAEAGWYLAQCLVWVKNAFTLGRQDYQWQHEPVLYGWKPGAAHYWQGGFAQASVIDDEEKGLAKLGKAELVAIIQRLRNARDTTVVREPRNSANLLHPTVKPLALVARQIWNSSRSGETVAELFSGSGTTIIAAEQTGRKAVATELDPKFCAVGLQRAKEHGLPIEKISYALAT